MDLGHPKEVLIDGQGRAGLGHGGILAS
jgi:hypothetical protein